MKNQVIGSIVRRLRRIVGLSVAECAARMSLDPEAVRQLEHGELDVVALEAVATLFGLDVDDLANGEIHPTADAEGSTIFLLHGAHQQFDASDLGVMFDALATARESLMALSAVDAVRRRMELTPSPVAGPLRADAAKQGYKLARLVRARTGDEAGAVGDLGVVATATFGVAVLDAQLRSPRLRAAAIVDSGRLAAAAVLAVNDPDRQQNDALTRVYLAHELCHILFDPAPPGTVRLALDEEQRGGVGRAGNDALYESRAKGFAAELLLPLAGLTERFGPASQEQDERRAHQLVLGAREHFGVPREITVHHLVNHGFIDKGLQFRLLDPQLALPARSVPSTTTQSLKGAGEREDELGLARSDANARRLRGDARSEVASRALAANSEGKVIEATDLLARWADDQLLASHFDEVSSLMSELDVTKYDPRVLTGLLTMTSAAREELGVGRRTFVGRVLSRMEALGWTEERVARVRERLA